MVFINPHLPVTPVTNPRRSTTVEPSTRAKPVQPKQQQVLEETGERRRNQDRRRYSRDQGPYDLRSGRDRRRNRRPSIEIDV